MHAAGYIRYVGYMPWEDQSRFQEFLEVIRDFRTSPLEIALILILLALFLAVIIFVYLRQKRKKEQRRKKWTEEQFTGLADHFHLSPEDREFLERMAEYIPNGGCGSMSCFEAGMCLMQLPGRQSPAAKPTKRS